DGPNFVDWVTVLERWVEDGEAPDSVLAKQIDRTTWPAKPNVIRERPICAYPEIARYDGTGDPDVAESYSCR
ncbi:MAG: tannase/feruloyl esterase family alpha/beta hydrolase, partial [Alphaproteobacteria bacterium]